RPGDTVQFLLASGTGAALARESGVRDAEFVVALDVTSGARAPGEPLIRIASRVEREWLQPTSSEVAHRFDAASGRVRAARVERYDALVLSEQPVPVDEAIAAGLLAEAWIARGPRDEDQRLLRRLAFAAIE